MSVAPSGAFLMEEEMEKLKSVLKSLWSKPVLAAVIVALAAALGYEVSADDAERLACLFQAAGC